MPNCKAKSNSLPGLLAMSSPTLVLIHEPEAACLNRLLAEGFDKGRAAEISSYLAQSTDLSAEFDDLSQACKAHGLAFCPVELDDAPAALAAQDRRRTLVWTLTDGIA
jgi:D-alanine-D-alanine ligase